MNKQVEYILNILKFYNSITSKELYKLKLSIKQFNNIDKHNISIKQILIIIKKLLSINRMLVLPIDICPITKGSIFYRARKINSIKELRQWGPSDIWNPPKESMVTTYGRINKPYQNYLYLADTAQTAIEEINPQPGDYLIEFPFKIIKPLYITKVIFNNSLLFNKIKANKLLAQKYSVGLKVAYIYINFLKREFSQKVNYNWEYKTSVAIAQYIFYHNHIRGLSDVMGWLYPSTKFDKISKNNLDLCVIPDHEFEYISLDKTDGYMYHIKGGGGKLGN